MTDNRSDRTNGARHARERLIPLELSDMVAAASVHGTSVRDPPHARPCALDHTRRLDHPARGAAPHHARRNCPDDGRLPRLHGPVSEWWRERAPGRAGHRSVGDDATGIAAPGPG